MKLGIIIDSNDPETAWNGIRFGNTALQHGHEVKIFLMGSGVEVENITHEKYNAAAQLRTFVANNGETLACGTCMKSRNKKESDVCPISTMVNCVNMVEWADKVVSF